MHRTLSILRTSAVLLGLCGPITAAAAQSINIDYGDLFGTPDAKYPAAGRPGVWNALDGSFGPHALVDLDGNPVAAQVTLEPSGPTFGDNNPNTIGFDEALMDDATGGWVDVVGRVVFSDLQPGVYRVLTYAWITYDPENMIWVWMNEEQIPAILSGPWPKNGLQEGVTHSVHVVRVPRGQLQVNLVSGFWIFDDWWLNGLQLDRLGASGDVNCDGGVDAFDIEPFILALTDPEAYERQYPNCHVTLADIDGDGEVTAFDIEPFIGLLLP